MKRKNVLLTLLIAGMLCIAGCGAKNADADGDHQQNEQTDEQGGDAQTDNETDTAEADAGTDAKQDGAEGDAADESAEWDEEKPLAISIDDYFEDKKHDTVDYFGVATVRYPLIHLSEACAKAYPELAKTLAEENEEQQKVSREQLDMLKGMYDEDMQMRRETDEENADAEVSEEDIDYSYYYSDEISAKILRADSKVLCIAHEYSGYSGGAHGYYSYMGVCYDSQSGKQLALADVVKDTDKLFELVIQKLPEEYPDVRFSGLEDYFKEFDGTDETGYPWSMDSTGLTLYFNPYVLASYAEGAQVITVPFDEAPEIFEEKYTQSAKRYITPIEEYRGVYVDADGDGKTEKVSISGRVNEDGCYFWDLAVGGQTISTDGDDNAVDVGSYSYAQESYVVCSDKGNYVYLIQSQENDYRVLSVIDLKTMKFVDPKEENRNLSPLGNWFEPYTTFYALTDPEEMLLASRIDCMSTYGGCKRYHVSDSGFPVSEDELYTTDFNYVLTAKKDIACKTVDEKGNVTDENATIPKGSYLRIVRTNGDNLVDLLIVEPGDTEPVDDMGMDEYNFRLLKSTGVDLNGATLYRLETYRVDWEPMLNDVPVSDLLDGMMYAG